MESHVHSLNTLFKQLGLNSTDAAIEAFITSAQADTDRH